jgi:hypothetical protein
MSKDKTQISNKSNGKILITGAKGMLGQELTRQFSKLPATGYKLILTDKDELDITDKRAVSKFIGQAKPNFIIHAAAYVDVDQAEKLTPKELEISREQPKKLTPPYFISRPIMFLAARKKSPTGKTTRQAHSELTPRLN